MGTSTSKKTKISMKERLRRAQQAGGGLPTRTMNVWLGVDVALLEEYLAATAAADQSPDAAPRGRRLGQAAPVVEAQQRAAELREQLEEFRVAWKVRALDSREWAKLLAAHPPRKSGDEVDPVDANVGWNSETMPPALVRAATVDPVLDDEDWKLLLGDDFGTPAQLSWGQIDSLAVAVFNLTKKSIDIPF